MRPAFSSLGQASSFALLLLCLLLSPALMGKRNLPPRDRIYSSYSSRLGAYSYLQQQIFQEKGDIDIAFVGSSHIWLDINTTEVQEKLSQELGRPAVVRTFGWSKPGFDALYFIAQDLLERRKVRLLVFYDEVNLRARPSLPHRLAFRWFRLGDNRADLDSLSIRSKASYYAAAILGMPRNLLNLLRPNLPEDKRAAERTRSRIYHMAADPADRLGSAAIDLEYNTLQPVADYQPHSTARPSDVCIYSPATKDKFAFSGPDTPELQLRFARKFGQLLAQHGTQIVLLCLPRVSDMKDPLLQARTFWPDIVASDMTMIGIPPATLFQGLSESEVLKLYYDPDHFNRNGQKYYTSIIAPRIVETYVDKVQP
jgi:hypothetical protein